MFDNKYLKKYLIEHLFWNNGTNTYKVKFSQSLFDKLAKLNGGSATIPYDGHEFCVIGLTLITDLKEMYVVFARCK